MTIWIKLCGLSTDEDVGVAVECDVQAIGFVFAKSVRCVNPSRAAKLAANAPSTIARVAVMLRPGQAEVDAVLADFRPDYLQADWQALAELRLPESVKALPVFRQGDGVVANATPARFVYEGARSGQGETLDWPAVRPFAKERELILAGGLNPENVGEAVQQVAPFGVDVSSGIERKRGIKDAARMRDFVAAARTGQAATTQ